MRIEEWDLNPNENLGKRNKGRNRTKVRQGTEPRIVEEVAETDIEWGAEGN